MTKRGSFIVTALALFLAVGTVLAPQAALAQTQNKNWVTPTRTRPAVNEMIIEPLNDPNNIPVEKISVDPRMPARGALSLQLSPGVGNAFAIAPSSPAPAPKAQSGSDSKVAMTTFPPNPNKDFYLDCPNGTVNTYCVSALTPSEKSLLPMTEKNVRNPNTGRSACLLRGCIKEQNSKDVGCYTYATCEPVKR